MLVSFLSSRRFFALASSAAFVLAIPLGAQVIEGRIVDESSKKPVPEALVELLDANAKPISGITARTDTDGTFALYPRDAGSYEVQVTRVGYEPVASGAFKLGATDVAQLSIPLSTVAGQVAAVTVLAQRPLTQTELDGWPGFEYRRAHNFGHYLTADQLSRLSSMDDIVHTGAVPDGKLENLPLPSVAGRRSRATAPALVMQVRGENCMPLLLLDTRPLQSWDELNATVNMETLAGVEIYRRDELPSTAVGSAPIASGPSGSPPCAIVMVWTKAFLSSLDVAQRGK